MCVQTLPFCYCHSLNVDCFFEHLFLCNVCLHANAWYAFGIEYDWTSRLFVDDIMASLLRLVVVFVVFLLDCCYYVQLLLLLIVTIVTIKIIACSPCCHCYPLVCLGRFFILLLAVFGWLLLVFVVCCRCCCCLLLFLICLYTA